MVWLVYLAAFALPLFVAPWLAGATGWPVNSTVTRLMITFGVAALLWHLGLPKRDPDARFAIGKAVRTALLAMAVTIGVTALYSAALIAFGAESLRPWDAIFKPSRLATALATGLAVSVVEEPFFRRFLLKRLALGGHLAVGALLSSAAYALVHYLRPASVPRQDSYSLADSAGVYLDILTNFLRPFSDPGRGLGLFLLGLLLCFVVRRGGLPWTIGIHAGVVYFVKADACVLYWNHHDRHFWFGSFDVLYDGAMFWIVCTAFVVAMWMARPPRDVPA